MLENTRCGFCPASGAVAGAAFLHLRAARASGGSRRFHGGCRKTRGAAFVPRQRCVPSPVCCESVGRKPAFSRGEAGKHEVWLLSCAGRCVFSPARRESVGRKPAVSRGDAGKREVRLLSRAGRCGWRCVPCACAPRERQEEAGGFTGRCRKTRGAVFVLRRALCFFRLRAARASGGSRRFFGMDVGKSAAWAAKRPRDAGIFA